MSHITPLTFGKINVKMEKSVSDKLPEEVVQKIQTFIPLWKDLGGRDEYTLTFRSQHNTKFKEGQKSKTVSAVLQQVGKSHVIFQNGFWLRENNGKSQKNIHPVQVMRNITAWIGEQLGDSDADKLLQSNPIAQIPES